MDKNGTMRVGIIGAGWIAEKAAITLNGMTDCEAYAIGSRSLEKAKAFARKWNMPKAYGSYAEVINDPQTITVYKRDRVLVDQISVPQQITGYEYQFSACRKALIDGLLEPREMPHQETLYIMQLMDDLRAKWGVRYPMD